MNWRMRLVAVSGTDEWWGVYGAYLKSPEWRALRGQVLERAASRCEDCGEAVATQVHHLSYRRVGDEQPDDLRALCNRCHDRRHGLEGMTFAQRWALAADPTETRP